MLAFLLPGYTAPTTAGYAVLTVEPAVLLAAVLGGWQPAAMAAIAALFAAWRWFHPDPATMVALGVVCAVQVPLFGLLARAVRRLEEEKARVATAMDAERRMMQELNHRFANGMQLVASVLSLQGARLASVADARSALEAAVDRLHVVAAIHRHLHGVALGRTPLVDAIQAVATDVLLAAGAEEVRLDIEMPPVPLGLARATSIAMVVAEAVSNAARHAFPNRSQGRLRITLVEDVPGRLRLTIADNGIGLAAGAPDQEDRIGLQIVQSMAARLQGTAALADAPGGGAVLSVTFPAEERGAG